MLLAEVGYALMGFILYIRGAQGQQKSVCALKGSTVRLSCSAERLTSSMKWYIVHRDGSKLVLNELEDRRLTSSVSEEGNFTLTINDLTGSDAKIYCCTENKNKAQKCSDGGINLQVTDLQVKVIPATENQTVNLMCSTSCALNESYIWYRNREFLYEDWSPWYQELVSSEEGVTYSCAIKGHKHLRAPDVSVDSVSSTCFTVTYSGGRMCFYQQKLEDEPCSITYPRGEVSTNYLSSLQPLDSRQCTCWDNVFSFLVDEIINSLTL
ncbi:hypothetical protein Q5P01_025571 [Channa striata]|uniref:Ig-like domain-containing protein n=1 Tax=Channa striata TaxID=64152 RepID=A0AA88LHG5_CHASR|nr:hypothetical protein Q5P01_025571 [Channa striata]